ncbi:collagen-like protein [Microbispora sp. GKU 823]|uniref:collagen-like protein n=1 Tax=Microbispora sp. GKU 823 TaxID=1652100 RepID=UPI00117D7B50|nr:collagen-like protein [Microbispora sp. GKU 823]
MRMNPPVGDVTLDPGRGMAWVDEHGAHLVDYASGHLESGPMLAAVIAALESCAARERPGNVSDRAWLLSALRREVATGPGRGFLPGPGPGGPDHLAVRRAWRLADPLGAETLLLLYRHELPLRDLVYVLALPLKEAGRLIARTQDVVEILVSGLDGLARGRPICPEIAPLAAAVFPDEHGEAADFGAARTALLRHIVTCVVCKRPINIRYTVPQILSRPPVADLTPETRQRLLDALDRARRTPAERTGHRPPSSFGMPLSAPVGTAPVPATPAPALPASPPAVPPSAPPDSGLSPVVSGEESRPPSREDREAGEDREDTGPGRLLRPAQPETPRPAGTAADAVPELPERPVRAFSQEDTQPSLPWPSGTPKSRGTQRPNPFPGPSSASRSPGSRGATRSPGSQGTGSPGPVGPIGSRGSLGSPGPAGSSGPVGSAGPAGSAGSLGYLGAAGAARGAHPASGEAAELPPGQDTPLYNALLSQIRAREAPAHAAEAVPAPAHVPDTADAVGKADLTDRPVAGAQIRIIEVLARVGTLLRATALRIVIVVIAGAAGTVTGINLFAPASQSQKGSLEASVAQASANPTGTGANPSATGRTDGAAVGGTTTGGTAAGGAAAGEGATSTASGTPQTTVTATAAGGAAQPGGQSTAAGGGAQPGGQQGTAAGGAAQPGGQGATSDTPASPGAFLMGNWGVQAPSVITLDAFGRGTITLSTTSGKPVKWRISAPGLVVEPSSGTLKPGHTDVLTVRALRVRYWCGVPSPVTAPLELHGPKGKRTATVRWSTC